MRAAPVILNQPGQERRPRHSLTIHVPRGYEQGEVRVVGHCHVCGAMFGQGEENAWQTHVGKCARKHLDEIRATTPRERQRGTPFDPDNWDPEVDAHMLEVGRKMLREGRMNVLPSERAGFS